MDACLLACFLILLFLLLLLLLLFLLSIVVREIPLVQVFFFNSGCVSVSIVLYCIVL